MGYIRQKLRYILVKNFGIYYGIYLAKTNGIYGAKTMGYSMGYIGQKLCETLGKTYGIYWVKLWVISGK